MELKDTILLCLSKAEIALEKKDNKTAQDYIEVIEKNIQKLRNEAEKDKEKKKFLKENIMPRFVNIKEKLSEEKGWQKIFKEKGLTALKDVHEDLPKVASFLKRNKAKKVLDLGCGSGRHVIYLAQAGFDVYGTDDASEGIRLCEQELKKLGLKANLKVASFFKKFPFKSNFFDAIISTWAIHHGTEKQVKYCIKEIERVLKPKGIIYISVTSTFKGRPVEEKKQIEPHTWIVTKGLEKDVPHHIFTKDMVISYFKNFEVLDIHKDNVEHWCILGKLKK